MPQTLTIEEAKPEGWDLHHFAEAILCYALVEYSGEEPVPQCEIDQLGNLLDRPGWALPNGERVARNQALNYCVREARSWGLVTISGSRWTITPVGRERARELELEYETN